MAIKELSKLIRLDEVLKKGRPLSGVELAQYIGVSRSTLYNMFDELKELGAEIEYDAKWKTFLYANEFNIELKIHVGDKIVLGSKELIRITGGNNFLTSVQDFGQGGAYICSSKYDIEFILF